MTLLWIEGFEGYEDSTPDPPDPTMILNRYIISADEDVMDMAAGRYTNSKALKWPVSFNRSMTTPDLGAQTRMITGFNFQLSGGPTIQRTLLVFVEVGGNDSVDGMNVRLENSGELSVYRGGTNIATTSGLGLTGSTWYHLTFDVTLGNSPNGAYELKIDGSTVLSGSSMDTQSGSTQEFRWVRLWANNNVNVTWDDWWIDNATNHGEARVHAIYPDAAGDDTDWTPDSGNNYDRVNETDGIDEDTSYVESGTSLDTDLYNYDSLPTGVLSDVVGIQINTDARTTNAGFQTLETVCKSGTTESNDAGTPLSGVNWRHCYRIMEQDPDTATAWTSSGLNSAQFGMEVG